MYINKCKLYICPLHKRWPNLYGDLSDIMGNSIYRKIKYSQQNFVLFLYLIPYTERENASSQTQ